MKIVFTLNGDKEVAEYKKHNKNTYNDYRYKYVAIVNEII